MRQGLHFTNKGVFVVGGKQKVYSIEVICLIAEFTVRGCTVIPISISTFHLELLYVCMCLCVHVYSLYLVQKCQIGLATFFERMLCTVTKFEFLFNDKNHIITICSYIM